MADNGLIHGYRFDGLGNAQPLEWADFESGISDWQNVWLHFDYTHSKAATWLNDHSGLDPLVVEALLSEDTRPRCSVQNSEMLLALRGVNLNPGADPEDMVSIRIWTDGQRIISTRHRLLLSINDLVDTLQSGQGPHKLR